MDHVSRCMHFILLRNRPLDKTSRVTDEGTRITTKIYITDKPRTKKEIIKEPEPNIGLDSNERLPLQQKQKKKNINTIILFFFTF